MTTNYRILNLTSLSKTSDWNIKQFFNTKNINSTFDLKTVGTVIKRYKKQIIIDDTKKYKRITIKTNCGGVVVRDEILGTEIKTKSQYYVKSSQLAVSKIDARNGAFGIIPPEADGAIITGNFWVYDVNPKLANINYLTLILSSNVFMHAWQDCSNGSGNRLYLQENKFLNCKIPIPDIKIQKQIIDQYKQKIDLANKTEKKADRLENDLEQYVFSLLGITPIHTNPRKTILQTINFQNVYQWGYDKISVKFPYRFDKYKALSFTTNPNWIKNFYRGKSPHYSNTGNSIILNQKCNRKDEITLKYAKTVDADWLSKIDNDFLTRKNDILINSTGEGTLGRASLVTADEHIGLAYDSHMLLLRVNQDEIAPQLFVYLFNSSFGQKQVEIYKTAQATKQTELGIENTKKILFPLPDITLQREISKKIQEQKAKIFYLRQHAETLRQQAKQDFETAIFNK